jgi:DNA invertase Pin-like site-specific DNA recombinase
VLKRTRNGLKAAHKQGRIGGRCQKLKVHQQEEIVKRVSSGQKNAADTARLFNVHPAVISRFLQRSKNYLTGFSSYRSSVSLI